MFVIFWAPDPGICRWIDYYMGDDGDILEIGQMLQLAPWEYG